MWVFMTLLPTLMLNSERRDVPLGTRDYVGWALWGLGFATEAIADQQKWIFKSDPNNAVSQRTFVRSDHLVYLCRVLDCSKSHLAFLRHQGKFIQSGLWGYSRHPNYLGEILQWSGLWLSASSVMAGPQYLSVASPLFVWFLLRYVSGIPMLEKHAMRKWGSDPAFQHYVKNTPLLWPFPKF